MFLLLIIFALILGLWMPYLEVTASIILVILLLLFILYKEKKWKYRLIIFVFLIIGLIISIIKIPVDTSKTEFTGLVIISKNNYYIVQVGLNKFYIYETNHTKEVGDFISFSGNLKLLSFKTYESYFNFETYLNHKGVYYQLYVNNETYKYKTFLRVCSWRRYFLSKFETENYNFLNEILFKINNDSDTYNLISEIRLTFLFTSSGLHLSLLYNWIYKLLKTKLKKDIANIILIVIEIISFLFIPIKVYILRILIKKIFTLFRFNNKNISNLNLLCFNCLIVILLNYHFVYDSGFLIGYLYSFVGLIINETFSYFPKYKKLLISSFTFLILSIITSSIFYSEFNVFSFLIIPFLTVVVTLIITLSFIGYLFGLNNFISIIRKTYDFIVTFSSKISIKLVIGEYSLYFILILFALLVMYLYLNEIKAKKQKVIVTLIILINILLSSFPLQNYIYDSISFINVGQGDSILITHNTTNILIDTGGNQSIDLATNCLIPYFKKNHISKLDYVFITHQDSDHCGSLASLQTHFEIKNIVYQTNEYFKIDDIEFHNLNYNADVSLSENNQSLVLAFEFINKNWVLMGDAEVEIEEKIMTTYENVECDYLKVGHHGSKTSSSEEFIKYLHPKEAIISVGKNNSYGHPHEQVITTLENNNVNIRRTDEEGTIIYKGF